MGVFSSLERGEHQKNRINYNYFSLLHCSCRKPSPYPLIRLVHTKQKACDTQVMSEQAYGNNTKAIYGQGGRLLPSTAQDLWQHHAEGFAWLKLGKTYSPWKAGQSISSSQRQLQTCQFSCVKNVPVSLLEQFPHLIYRTSH